MLQASAFGGVFTGFSIARDFESGFGRRLMLAAPNRVALLAGYAMAALVRTAFIWVILTVVALLVGMQVGGGAVDLDRPLHARGHRELRVDHVVVGHRAALPLVPGRRR